MRHTVLLIAAALVAQGAQPSRVLGTVTAVNAQSSELSLQTDQGELYGVRLIEPGLVLQLAPGETSLAKGEKIHLADVAVGDRVLARGEMVAGQKALLATALIVNRKEAITSKQERDRAAWIQRGVLGVVSAVDPASGKITIEAKRFRQSAPIVITVQPGAVIRRYAEDSVRFADAKPSSIEKIQVNDQLRALGENSAGGAAMTAEEVVFGTFRTVAGRVIAVDAANNRLTLEDSQTKQKLTVRVTADSNLRQMPAFSAPNHGAERGERPGGTFRPAGGPGAGGWQGFPGHGGSAPDPAQMLERFPKIELAGVKPGEAVMVATTASAKADAMTAITLVAGVDAMLSAPHDRGAAGGGQAAGLAGWSLDIGLPQ